MRKPAARKPAVKRKPRAKKKTSWFGGKGFRIVLGLFAVLLIFGTGYYYRTGIAYYLGYKSHKVAKTEAEEKRLSDVRNFQVLSKYPDKVVGFDVSQYQGEINWDKVKFVENTFSLDFVFIRATAGKDVTDACFSYNWAGAKKRKIIRGAYHYYRPNENSLEQAQNFIKAVKLRKGDLPPVLDIEALPKDQPMDSLKSGLKRWLRKIDSHYKVRPIIYTGEKYYNAFLKDEFSEYTFWIANYNFFVEEMKDDWQFWQFTEKASVSGIPGNVDINIYNGTPKQLSYLTVN